MNRLAPSPFPPSTALFAATTLLLAACAGDDSRDHVFRTRPPAPAPTRVVAPATPAVERPLGASGPMARIESVRLASTGVPAPLGELREPIDVLVVVSPGRRASPLRSARAELRLRGAIDTSFVAHVAAPVPVVIAHRFRVPVGERDGLPAGRYTAQVRLYGALNEALATSIPMTFFVRR